jgi:hypothetical protein
VRYEKYVNETVHSSRTHGRGRLPTFLSRLQSYVDRTSHQSYASAERKPGNEASQVSPAMDARKSRLWFASHAWPWSNFGLLHGSLGIVDAEPTEEKTGYRWWESASELLFSGNSNPCEVVPEGLRRALACRRGSRIQPICLV